MMLNPENMRAWTSFFWSVLLYLTGVGKLLFAEEQKGQEKRGLLHINICNDRRSLLSVTLGFL